MSESIRRWKLIFRSAALIQRNLLLLESIVFWGFFFWKEVVLIEYPLLPTSTLTMCTLIPSSLAHPSCSSFHKMIDIPKDRSIEIRALRSISLFFEKKYNRYGFFV